MQYVIKSKGKFVGSSGKLVEHFNDARFFATRNEARDSKEKGEHIYRVRVRPVEFERVK